MSRGAGGPPAGGAAHASKPSSEVIGQLKQLVSDALRVRLDRMFDGADDLLFKISEQSRSADERKLYFDTMRIVRLHRPAIGRVFHEKIVAGFEPGAKIGKKAESRDITFEELSLCEPQAIEEQIAITNMIGKAESLYDRALWEIRRRMDWLIQHQQAQLSPHALSPELFCNAFCASSDSLKLDFQIELVIYKLFDRLVIADLADLYAAVLKFFDQHGIKAQAVRVPTRVTATGRHVPVTDAPAAGAAAPPPMPAGHVAGAAQDMMNGALMAMPMPPLDMNTLGTLRMVHGMPLAGADEPAMPQASFGFSGPAGQAGDPAYYSDADLAAELAMMARGGAVQGWAPQQSYASVQRTGLVGQMFNDILSDPVLPDHLKPRFDDLRFGVIKAALKDGEFFNDPKHPVRDLVNELATMAAEARTMGLESLRRIEEVVSRIQGQFGEMAMAVRGAAQTAERVPEEKIERFLDEQLVQSKTRRQALIAKARRVVAEELQLRLAGHYVPDAAKALLQSGWSPMMSLRLLRTGMDSPPWRQGLVLLERILHALDPQNRRLTEDEQHELFADIEDTWRSVDMAPRQIREELRGYRMALEEVDRLRARDTTELLPLPTAPPAAAAPAAPENFGPAVNALLARLSDAESRRAAVAAKPAAPAAPPAAAAAPSPPGVPEQLDAILVPGSWFKVHDHTRKESRWLKFIARYREDDRPDYRDSVAFAEFNGKNTLMVKTEQLLQDMVAGLAEPYEQSPMVRKAVGSMLIAWRSAGRAAANA